MSSVLVDTSVWRRYFAGTGSVRHLGDLLDEPDRTFIHPWIIGELVLGGLSAREERLLQRLPSAAIVPDAEVMLLIRHKRLSRRGIGWVDVHLLASALAASLELWTLDRDLRSAAADLGAEFLLP